MSLQCCNTGFKDTAFNTDIVQYICSFTTQILLYIASQVFLLCCKHYCKMLCVEFRTFKCCVSVTDKGSFANKLV